MSSSSSSPIKSPEIYADSPNILYDTDYYVNINKKMQVPDKIQLVNNNSNEMLEDPAIVAIKKMTEGNDWMRVPERICVVGGEGHVATREPPPEMRLENSLLVNPLDLNQLVQLTTPPRTLRIEDTAPPFTEDSRPKRTVVPGEESKMLTADSKINDSLMPFEDGDLSSQVYVQLRRRMLQLTHRVDSLEIDNRRRKRRDYLLYAISVIYILVRGFNWLATRNRY